MKQTPTSQPKLQKWRRSRPPYGELHGLESRAGPDLVLGCHHPTAVYVALLEAHPLFSTLCAVALRVCGSTSLASYRPTLTNEAGTLNTKPTTRPAPLALTVYIHSSLWDLHCPASATSFDCSILTSVTLFRE